MTKQADHHEIPTRDGSTITVTPLNGQWTVTHGTQTLHTNGNWDWTPTHPEPGWNATHTFDLNTALRLARQQAQPTTPTQETPVDYPYDADPADQDYIYPTDRPTEWACMAADYAAAGRSLADIAASLCVSEDTATALIHLHHTETTA